MEVLSSEEKLEVNDAEKNTSTKLPECLTEDIEMLTDLSQNIIKHIVISGGGVSFFIAYGVLKESHKSGHWKLENIKTVYGTSAGAVINFILLLNFDWKVLDDYVILRPWQNVFKIDVFTIINSLQTRGILNIRAIEEIIEPLLLAKDMDLTITLKDFYEKTGIEYHVFTSQMENFCLVDISYKTHPDWKLSEAIYSSCCLPFLFSPFMKDGRTYIDGGIFCNYPFQQCCQNGAIKEEIFGIRNNTKDPFYKPLTNESTLFDFILDLIFRILYKIADGENTSNVLSNEILLDTSIVSIYDIYLASSNIKQREQLIENGINSWKQYIESRKEKKRIDNV
jgi:predicted acylesterase/phospholipase RssA